MNPKTPASCSPRSSLRFPGTAPPQNPTSTATAPRASAWNLDNPNELWYAADRPYGLIEASIIRDDLPAAPEAWLGVKGFV